MVGKVNKLPLEIGEDSSPDDSARATHTKSVGTKVTAVAVCSAPIPLQETTGSLVAFKQGYQQLFDEFKCKLVG